MFTRLDTRNVIVDGDDPGRSVAASTIARAAGK